MADRRISGHTALTGAGTADTDLHEIVDVSDTTDGVTGTNKKQTIAELKNVISSTFMQTVLDDTTAAAARTTLGAADTASAVMDGDTAGGVLAGTYPSPSFAVDMATQAELNAHEADTTSIHGITDTTLLETTAGAQTKVDTHVNDTSAAHAASAISNTAAGNIAATDVQAAINELDTEKQPVDSDLTAIAALTTTSFGRSLLTQANAAATQATLGLTPGTDVQAQDAELQAIAGLTSIADRLPYFTGSGTAALATFTTAGRALIDDADAAAQRTTLGAAATTDVTDHVNDTTAAHAASAISADSTTLVGVGTTVQAVLEELDDAIAGGGVPATTWDANTLVKADTNDTPVALTVGEQTLVGRITAGVIAALTPAQVRTLLGLVIGTDVQAYDADLAALAGVTSAADTLPYFNGAGTATTTSLTATGRSIIDDTSVGAVRTTLDVPSNAEAILDTIGTTKGNVIGFSAASTTGVLAPGTDGFCLTADAASTLGIKWSNAGSGDMVAANNLSDVVSVATARTNLGLGTSNSPEFTAVNVGAATDTTVARLSAGDITVEGNLLYRAGGTDVPIADGGTGSSTAAGAATALGVGTGDSPQFTGINVGHATDTTVTRESAGDILVEGNHIYRVGGTDVSIADGGTGASSAGSALGNLGGLAVNNNLSDVAVATTARTNLGVGTGDSPQFTAVNIGHASDTTLARVSAGVLSVEGNTIYAASGTDVPITDGGTGASVAATALSNLGGQPIDATLTALAGLATGADKISYSTGTDTFSQTDFTASGAWVTWTPALSGGWATGNATSVAKYVRIGRVIFFYAIVTIGSSTTKGTDLLVSLPVTAASALGAPLACTAQFGDNGTTVYGAVPVGESTTTFSLRPIATASANATLGTTVTATNPFTWTTADLIYYGGTYEAAS